MDAVAPYETTPFIRRHADTTASMHALPPSAKASPARRNLSAEEIKREAMDAVTDREMTSEVRLAPHGGRVFAMHTPNMAAARSADRITQLHNAGLNVDTVHGFATKDQFEVGL